MIKNTYIKNKTYPSIYATKDEDAYRLKPDNEDFRTPFFRDIDKIIHSLSYARYADKTQVFTYFDNDHVSKRMIHVQLVSKIARTIGRALGLNEDLIEAAALGHDIGHVPFGHNGEYILSEISEKHGEGYFNHNIESVRHLMVIENHGLGKNLTIQVLDAIMCHNGELVLGKYAPRKKTTKEFLEEYQKSYKDKDFIKHLIPMTLEGCVVRISDVIAYLGRDIEDAIAIGKFDKNKIPKKITDVLGNTNSMIVDTIVKDIIKNSFNKPYIKLSKEIFHAINELKDFNYQNIYSLSMTKEELEQCQIMFETIFDDCLKSLKNKDKDSNIYKFILDMNEEYKNNTSYERMIIDYIAGMTDDFIKKQYEMIKEKILI